MLFTGNTCVMASKFLYFAYGSNLLAQRLHINNPSAVRVAAAKLENYRLDFGTVPSRSWGGTPATIVPDDSEHCWGAVWEIDLADLPSLDRQEGVGEGLYFPRNVTVTSLDGERYLCRTYQLTETPPALGRNQTRPLESRPSYIYWQVIIQGARESGLPQEYIQKLNNIQHNGYNGTVAIPVQISESSEK
ncbi:gamma-glutamylcyclotransferase-like isoform X3 [Bacillus rossius redtenbacheri]|uniref:gamma-glutamylcyclotransferase-like isoform X3 n=1 Tax=Bacillus rossius redtenbacheri TaxID=93214 RepID=UPI002FDE948A